MEYRCELQDRPAQPTLVVRRVAAVEELPRVLGPAWGLVMAYAGPRGLTPSGPPFTAYHGMDMTALDLEIGFPFAATADGEGDVVPSEIPGGKMGTCLHVGPYDKVGGAYQALDDWMKANGQVPDGPAYEFYLNDPQSTPPTELQTLVMFPLAG